MTYFEYINENIETIKYEIKIGLMPCVLMKHIQIYTRFDYYIRLGRKRCVSILNTAEDFSMNERSVYYIIKRMESEI